MFMPKLLQIDSCLGILSTGKITESIGQLAQARGWDCYIAHGARYVGKSLMHSYQIGSKWSEYCHYFTSLMFDNHGLGSCNETKRLIQEIERIRPDIIHLHCIHGYYINYKYLFQYLNLSNIPVVWTFHDCWAFTGHCAHFVTANCYKWKEFGCFDCPLHNIYPKSLIDRSKKNYNLKKNIFSANENLHIVSVSNWIASFVSESFLADKDIRVINNGIDVHSFYPCSLKSTGKVKIVGVASVWTKNKGLYDFFKLRELLPSSDFDITLVGLSKEQICQLPAGINGLSRTYSIHELAELYSNSNVFVNPTYADSFPTVNLEALACGTPVITYKTGGSPESIDEKTGIVVEQGDIDGLIKAIYQIDKSDETSKACRKRAEQMYDKDKRFLDYINLYEELLNKKY